ncbi:MAG: NAD(P)-dependent oxidoreductase [Granulosicoccus sp.]|nr:NAD(P)-dependent oxidoreductase [Granulosicoccus sp.]
MSMTIGIAGTGRMGTAFARRLLETGHDVQVWNRTPENAVSAVDAGAVQAKTIAELTACDAIIVSLTDSAAVAGVVDELESVGMQDKLVIDMSTLLPEESQTLGARIVAAGAEYVECPVGGTVGPALKGQLLGMAGGNDASFARAKPILEQLCRRVEHMGAVGCGARMKLAVNLPLAIYWQTLGESLALLKDSGIPIETAVSMIADSSAGPTVLKNRMQVVLDTINDADQPGTFDIAGLNKDLKLALRLGESVGASQPIAQASVPCYEAALNAKLGHCDGASLTKRTAQHE